jgi:hypothetical protein
MKRARKALAASFVVTFAAGCDSKTAQPAAAPTVDVGAISSSAPASASATVATTGDAGTTADAPSSTVAALPPAPTVGRVARNPDGTCTWFPQRPPNGRGPGRGPILNPPPPHQVQCPPDAGSADGGT